MAAPKTCPLCKTGMNAMILGDLVLDSCESCDGFWFDANELGSYGLKLGLGKMPVLPVRSLGGPVQGLSCPNCLRDTLAPSILDQLTMYGCEGCSGWFVSGPEMAKLQDRYRERILADGPDDVGEPEAAGWVSAIRDFFFR